VSREHGGSVGQARASCSPPAGQGEAVSARAAARFAVKRAGAPATGEVPGRVLSAALLSIAHRLPSLDFDWRPVLLA